MSETNTSNTHSELLKITHESCEKLYNEEKKREEILNNRAKIYLSLLTFILGALFFKIELIETIITTKNITELCFWIQFILYIFTMLCFVIALLFVFLSIRIMKFEFICDPEKDIIKKITDEMTADDFLLKRSIDYAVARNRNSITNNKKASLLTIAIFFILAGLSSICLFMSFYTILKIK